MDKNQQGHEFYVRKHIALFWFFNQLKCIILIFIKIYYKNFKN